MRGIITWKNRSELMSDHRTYTEKEIAAIFKAAAEKQEELKGQRSASDGLSLTELQEIGKESGITPELIAQAAASLDATPEPDYSKKLLGLPLSISKTVELPGSMSEDAWLSLVAQMRVTFGAHGKLDHLGSLRTWRNGNLHISLESGPSGDVLRMRSLKGDAKPRLIGTLMGFLLAIFVIGEATLGSGSPLLTIKVLVIATMIMMGLGVFALPVIQLPKWAAERERQMDQLAARARQMVVGQPGSASIASENNSSTPTDQLDRIEKMDRIEFEESEESEEILIAAPKRERTRN